MVDYRLNSGTLVELADRVFDQWNAILTSKSREVDICNLALANIGDMARVTSIDPPDGSAQSVHCARFYPLARGTLLERHAWDFTTRQLSLTLKTNDREDWDFAYEFPSDATGFLFIVSPKVFQRFRGQWREFRVARSWAGSAENPYVYAVEINTLGERTIYSNTEDAITLYCSLIHDATHFSSLFVQALGHELASKLAGPIIKGDRGVAIAKEHLQLARVFEESARKQDSSKRHRAESQNRAGFRRNV